jgi:hypothetical protein
LGKSAFWGLPPPPRIFGIIDLRRNLEKILGLQSLTGKIRRLKDLGAPPCASPLEYHQFGIFGILSKGRMSQDGLWKAVERGLNRSADV